MIRVENKTTQIIDHVDTDPKDPKVIIKTYATYKHLLSLVAQRVNKEKGIDYSVMRNRIKILDILESPKVIGDGNETPMIEVFEFPDDLFKTLMADVKVYPWGFVHKDIVGMIEYLETLK